MGAAGRTSQALGSREDERSVGDLPEQERKTNPVRGPTGQLSMPCPPGTWIHLGLTPQFTIVRMQSRSRAHVQGHTHTLTHSHKHMHSHAYAQTHGHRHILQRLIDTDRHVYDIRIYIHTDTHEHRHFHSETHILEHRGTHTHTYRYTHNRRVYAYTQRHTYSLYPCIHTEMHTTYIPTHIKHTHTHTAPWSYDLQSSFHMLLRVSA